MRSGRLEAKFADKTNKASADDVHTPTPISPPGTKTPPTAPEKRTQSARNISSNTHRREASVPIDPDALNKALLQFEDSGRHRDPTPGESPKRKRQRIYGDRSGQDLHASYSLLHEDGSPATPSRSHKKAPTSELHIQKTEEANRTYSTLLRSEMFDSEIPQSIPHLHDMTGSRSKTPPANLAAFPAPNLTPSTPHKNLFSYSSPSNPTPSLTPRSHSRSERGPNINARSEIYSLSPVKYSSQTMLLSPRKTPRQVSKVPYKVLDAPELADDFYLNLVDWGSTGVLAVGLGESVYLWNSESGKVEQLCKLDGDQVTSVGQLASGGNDNKVFIWDGLDDRWLHRWGEQEGGHKAAVKAIAWSPHQRGLLASGGGTADRCIKFWNTVSTAQHSANAALTSTASTHHSLDLSALTGPNGAHAHADSAAAPGGSTPSNPHLLRSHDTGSQVCNLLFSQVTSELVSTHGFSQHAINIWKYPSMSQVVSLTGHTYRVLYLSMSPDGNVIVTGAGDETLRFWDAFGGGKGKETSGNARKGGLVKEWSTIR
ncbi:hypothetical protein MBLNU459_g0906t2 [Dothideomycetes sp. NU459]